MKLSVVKGSVWGLTFLIALTVFGILTNRGNMDTTADMENATLPLIYLDVAGREVNCLFGYKEPVQIPYVQNCLTPIPKDRTLDITVQQNG